MQINQLIHFPISTGTYSTFIKNIVFLASNRVSSYICVANVHMFIEAYKDIEFDRIIKQSDIVTPDGLPITWGLKFINGIKQERVAGMDLLPDLLLEMANQNLAAYFYGGSPSLLDKTIFYLKNNFPKLQIAGFYSPPFRTLTKEEDDQVIDQINSTKANIVFVVLGCPKQEKWMASMHGKINACMIGIGGALPVMVGLQKRAPRWMQRIGMEWFYRFCQEPRRLFKRYAVTNILFCYLITKEFIKQKLLKKKRRGRLY